MAYVFNEVEIIAFDIHTALNPVAFPQVVREQFRFLVNLNGYDEQYKSGQAVESEKLVITPISKREFKRNHFWKHYRGISFGLETAYWTLQIPYEIRPKNFDLKINPDNLGFEAVAEPVIFINSMGWSTNILIRLEGNISAEELRDFVGRLRGQEGSAPPFLSVGAQKGLTGIFKLLGDLVREEIYALPEQVGDTRSTPRHVIIAIAKATGIPKYFSTKWGLQPQMEDDERCALLGVLFGREIKIDKANELLNMIEDQETETEKVLVTRMRENADFAVSSYDFGTLLFPQEDALNKPKRREAITCMASNARSSTMMSLSMLNFSRAAKKNAAASDMLDTLRKRIRTVIVNLPDHYDNAYSQNWNRHHWHLNKIRAEEDSTEE